MLWTLKTGSNASIWEVLHGTVVTGQWGTGCCIEPACTGSGKCWFFPIWLSFEKPFFKNNHQCFIPFWGIKITFFFSNQQNRAIKWKNSSYLPLSRLAPCSSGALWWSSQYSGLHRGLSLWAGASNPWLRGTWNGKKELGLKSARRRLPLP